MKQNFLKLLLVLTVCSMTGCLSDDLDIQNNRRLLVKGKVIDGQGNGLPDIRVATVANKDLLAETRTDSSGNFRMVSLDEEFDPLDIFINVDEYYDQYSNEYSSRSYIAPQRVNRVLYDLGTIVLEKKAELHFTFRNASPEPNTLSYEIFYTPSDCRLPLNSTSPPEDCTGSEKISGIHTASSTNNFFQLFSIRNSVVLVRYSLNGGPLQTLEIPLTDERNSYVLEY